MDSGTGGGRRSFDSKEPLDKCGLVIHVPGKIVPPVKVLDLKVLFWIHICWIMDRPIVAMATKQ